MKELCLLLMTVNGISGCVAKEEPLRPIELFVEVRDDKRSPVSKAGIIVDNDELAQTDLDGTALLRLSGDEGRRVRIAIACPKGFVDRSLENGRTVFLRRVRPIGAQSWKPIREKFLCMPKRSESVLLVRALGGAGIGVKALGKDVGRTDESGIAHVLLTGHPGEEVEIVLDTSERPELRPQNPSRRVVVPAAGQILVFDERFEEKVPVRRKRARRIARRPRRL